MDLTRIRRPYWLEFADATPIDLDAVLSAVGAITDATTDDELTDLREQLATAARERAELNTPEAVEELERIADSLDTIATVEGQREAAAQERAGRAQAALDRVRARTEPEPDPADAPAEGEGEGDTPAPTADATPEPVAAGATPRVSRVATRRPPAMQRTTDTTPRVDPLQWGLVASANVNGVEAGARLDTEEALGHAFAGMIRASAGYRGPRVQMRVASRSAEFPTERTLGRDTRVNAERIRNVTSLAALTASGGICAPTPINYDLPVIGSNARPVRDNMLARFGADRGGVTLLPPPVLSDVTSAITTWTEANDQNPSNPSTKPCLTVTCPTEEETLVDAIVQCLKFGNYRARYFGEQIAAWMELVGVAHARHAETKLLTAIGNGSTAVTTGTLLSTTRDVLASVERVATAFRNRHRLPRNYPLRFAFPDWLYANIRTDLARELPGAASERLAVSEAEIDAFFRARNINPTSFMDGESGQVFGAQPDGHAIAWPSTVTTYLYPEGAWLFLDGGSLDLGLVRDSTLNATNDVVMFAETFENVAFHGVESFRLNIDICPSGKTQGTVSADPCTTGS